jgi:hypothetical protein
MKLYRNTYWIEMATDRASLTEQVNLALRKGAIPQGGIFLDPATKPGDKDYFYQAMLKGEFVDETP